MDRHLRPTIMDIDPGSSDAVKTWRHWKRTFNFFIESLTTAGNVPNKLAHLVHFVGPSVYELIADCETFELAIEILEATYDKPKNEIFARHLLSTCKQDPGQSLDAFFLKLKLLQKTATLKQ